MPKPINARSDEARGPAMSNQSNPYIIDCTGDVVVGDEIEFTEAVFGGSFRKPAYLGSRTIRGHVVRDSYGIDRQQHTFTIEVVESLGLDAPPAGTTIRRKGRNVYRNGTSRRPWADETARRAAQSDKHARGDAARAERDRRRAELTVLRWPC